MKPKYLWSSLVAKTAGKHGPRRLFRRGVQLARRHPRRLGEIGVLVAMAASFDALARWTGPSTGSLGEAEMIRILEAGSLLTCCLFLPLGIVRWVRAGAESADQSWAAGGYRLLAAFLAVMLASSATVTIQAAYGVEGWFPQVILLLGVGIAAAEIGESRWRDTMRGRRAASSAMPAESTPEAAVAAPIEDASRGRAARGQRTTQSVPEGVVARAEFFCDLEFELHLAQGRERPITLLVASPAADGLATGAGSLLGESLRDVFDGQGTVGYLGNELWGALVVGATSRNPSREAKALRERLRLAHAEGTDPLLGVAISTPTDTARDLYARALARHEVAVRSAGRALRNVG